MIDPNCFRCEGPGKSWEYDASIGENAEVDCPLCNHPPIEDDEADADEK